MNEKARGHPGFFKYLVMMVLVFFLHVLEIFQADGFFRGVDLCEGPIEDPVRLDAVYRIFHELPVLHHALYIVRYPGLFFAAGGHAHIAEELLFCERVYIVRCDFDVIVPNHLVYDERPFQLVDKGGEFLLYLSLGLGSLSAGLHPAF